MCAMTSKANIKRSKLLLNKILVTTYVSGMIKYPKLGNNNTFSMIFKNTDAAVMLKNGIANLLEE